MFPQCDCCDKRRPCVAETVCGGIETYACCICRQYGEPNPEPCAECVDAAEAGEIQELEQK